MLITDLKEINENNSKRVGDGKYSFQAIRPGKYRLFALDVVELLRNLAGGARATS